MEKENLYLREDSYQANYLYLQKQIKAHRTWVGL